MRTFALVLAVIAATRVAHASDATARIKDGFIATGATYAGLVFDDAACKRAFGSHGKVAAAQRKKFGTCLRGLLDHGQENAGMTDTAATVDLVTPTNGFEIVFTCSGPHKGSCYAGDGLVTSVRGYDKDGATAAANKQIDSKIAGKPGLYAVVNSCFYDSGKWKGSFVSRESGDRTFDDAAVRAASRKIDPYKIDGVAVPFCVDLGFSSR